MNALHIETSTLQYKLKFTCSKQLLTGLLQAYTLVRLGNTYTNGGEIKTKKLTSPLLVCALQTRIRASSS